MVTVAPPLTPKVSIPQSGFWWVELQPPRQGSTAPGWFQSPSRDSGGLNVMVTVAPPLTPKVSIPQSGFWWVERVSRAHCLLGADVSIPQSGFWWVELTLTRSRSLLRGVSIPQSGFWWVEPVSDVLCPDLGRSFNPPVGILVG